MSIIHNGTKYKLADAHAHIYPGKIAEKATDNVGAFYDIEMDNVGLPHKLFEMGTEAGVDRFLVSSVATKVDQVRAITDFIADKCKKYPQFVGLAAWHQDVTNISEELDYIQSLGLKGIKVHPDFQRFNIDDKKMIDVYKESARRNMPILFHTGDNRMDFSAPKRLAKVMEIVPDLTAIAAHLGGYQRWDEAKSCLKGAGVYIDTSSALFCVNKEQAMESILTFGVDHTMFGTDFPMWSHKTELERFFNLGFNEKDNQTMLYDVFSKVYL